MMRQVDVCRGADFFQVAGVHRSGDRLYFCRMTQDPCDRDGSFWNAVFSADLAQRFVKLRERRVVDETAVKEAMLERRPGLDRDIVQPAVIQNSAVPVDRPFCRQVIHVKRLIDELRLLDRELKLIEDQRLTDEFLEQLQLENRDVADAEEADFPVFL